MNELETNCPFRTWSSDQGVEAGVVDAPCFVQGSDFGKLRDMMLAMRRGLGVAGRTAEASGFFLPNALFYPDHLHITFNAYEEVVTGLPDWQGLETAFRAIAGFLGDRDLRGRLKVKCCRKTPKANLLNNFNIGRNFGWKWQYMSRFLSEVLPVFRMVKERFSRKVFAGNDKVANAKVDAFGEALQVDRLEAQMLILQAVGLASDIGRGSDPCLLAAHAFEYSGTPSTLFRTLVEARSDIASIGGNVDRTQQCHRRCGRRSAQDRNATWFEGCYCHEHLLQQGKRGRSNTAAYRRASATCPWKGRRAAAMACGHVEVLCANIMNASTPQLRHILQESPPEARLMLLHQEPCGVRVCASHHLDGRELIRLALTWRTFQVTRGGHVHQSCLALFIFGARFGRRTEILGWARYPNKLWQTCTTCIPAGGGFENEDMPVVPLEVQVLVRLASQACRWGCALVRRVACWDRPAVHQAMHPRARRSHRVWQSRCATSGCCAPPG